MAETARPYGHSVDSRKTPGIESRLRLTPMPQSFDFVVSPSSASYWWWYRTATEGAAGV